MKKYIFVFIIFVSLMLLGARCQKKTDGEKETSFTEEEIIALLSHENVNKAFELLQKEEGWKKYSFYQDVWDYDQPDRIGVDRWFDSSPKPAEGFNANHTMNVRWWHSFEGDGLEPDGNSYNYNKDSTIHPENYSFIKYTEVEAIEKPYGTVYCKHFYDNPKTDNKENLYAAVIFYPDKWVLSSRNNDSCDLPISTLEIFLSYLVQVK